MTEIAGRIAPGTQIGDYAIDRELPAKPGEVGYLGTHALLPRRARVQTLHPAFAGIRSIALQLMREACILEALRHPGVPRVYETGVLPDRRPWVALELVEGPTLADQLADGAALTAQEAISVAREVAEILIHAHSRGVVHRNLRPEAIARRPDGVCLLHWEDARAADADPGLQPLPEGSLDYQPPEVHAGAPADQRADVYALGMIAYEALTLDRSEESARDRVPAAPRRLTALIDRMRAHDPLSRPSASEVRSALLAIGDRAETAPLADDEAGIVVEEVDVEISGDVTGSTDSGDDPSETVEMAAAGPRASKLRWTPGEPYISTARTQTIRSDQLPSQLTSQLPSMLLAPDRRRRDP